MLGQRLIAKSPRLVRLGLVNQPTLKDGFYGVSSAGSVTSDPKNQNKQARVWNDGIHAANFKTSVPPERPVVGAVKVEDDVAEIFPGIPADYITESLQAGEHQFEPDRTRDISSQIVEFTSITQPRGDRCAERWDQSVPLSLDIQRNKVETMPGVTNSYQTPARTSMEQIESFDCHGTVSLHSVMQSMVPEPFHPNSTAPTHVNMPGGGHQMTLKYLNERELWSHQSRHHSTSMAYKRLLARKFSTSSAVGVASGMQGVQGDMKVIEEILERPSTQGVQGENCARFDLWLKNCGKFGDCTEQLEAVKTGRKTLQQIFDEQDEQIRLAAEKLKMSQSEGIGQSRD